MDSLLASYASSDDEDAAAPAASKRISAALPPPKSAASSALFSSLPAPKASAPSSLFSTLPPPKSSPSPSPSLFSDLPPPKTSQSSSSSSLFSFLPPPKPAPPLPTAAPRKSVVKFTPPVPVPIPGADSDDEDTSRKRKPQETSAPKSSSLVLPAPKNTLGLTPALGAARRSVLESVPADTSVAEPVPVPVLVPDAAGYESYGGYEGGLSQPAYSGGGEEGWVQGYAGNWPEEPAVTTDPDIADMVRAAGKRARRGVPMEIVEVKQDELMKNRPREDKHKATGIAFGPAYQAVSSGKEKPSKLHKRKHQIGSLYFDMKQKEMELAERRSRGFLTKAETQAKYGW